MRKINDRLRAERSRSFSEQLAGLLDAALFPFQRLAAIEFAAPWREQPKSSL